MKIRVVRFLQSVKQLPPQQVALVLSVGLVLGVFPVTGCPTLLCMLAALGLRRNAIALQLLNQVTSPLQWALLVPLARTGAWIRGDEAPPGSPVAVKLGMVALHAVLGWLCICVPLGILLYFVLFYTIRRRQTSRTVGLLAYRRGRSPLLSRFVREV